RASQTRAEYEHKLLTDLADAEQKVAELTEDAVKADRKMEEQLLRAPIDGTVQQLAVHTLGGVVTPAQQLRSSCPRRAASKSRPWSPTATSVSSKPGNPRKSRSILSILRATGSYRARCSTSPRTRWGATSRQHRIKRRPRPLLLARLPPPASRKAKSSSMPHASRSIARRCRSRTSSSILRPAWR